MADLFSIFTKKKIENNPVPYFDRIHKCYQTIIDTDKYCECDHCKANDEMSDKLVVICKWLVLDRQMKTGLTMCNGDIINTITQAFLKLESDFKKAKLPMDEPIDVNKL